MKIRSGFVSNSSTSSFIVAVKECDAKCPVCGERGKNGYFEMLRVISETFCNDDLRIESGPYSETIKSVLDWAEDYDKERYEEIKGLIDKYDDEGFKILSIELSNHLPVMQHLEEDDNFHIIYRDVQ